MKALRYSLFLEQPVITTSLLGDPNSSVSYNYLPGSQLRGLFISRYLQAYPTVRNASTHTAQHEIFFRLFFSGQIRFLNAYPLSEGKSRCLPTPFSLLRRKNAEYLKDCAIFDASHEEWDIDTRLEEEQGGQLKKASFPFCQIVGYSIMEYTPLRTVTIHIQRNRKKGRALREDGEIFHYDALAAGQWFEGVILIDKDSDVGEIKGLLNVETCWLGRSRSANYGKIKLKLNENIVSNWREIDAQPIQDIYPDEDEPCRLTLLSHFIGYDNEGKPLTDFDNKSLEAYLGVPVEIKATHSFSRVTAVGGFNNKWKLPLIQQYAIEAGSVITFVPQEILTAAEVQRLEQQGIGERRSEGFGRVVFDWNKSGSCELRLGKGEWWKGSKSTTLNLSPMAKGLAQRMASRLLEQRIEQGILQFVRDYIWVISLDDMPANSQLSRIQTLVRQALPIGDVGLVKRQFAKFERASIEQFERMRLEGQSLDRWITALLDHPDSVWDKVSVTEPKVAGESAQKEKLTQQTTLRLLAAVLAAPAHKRKGESL